MYRHITSNKSPYKKITYYTSYGDKVAHVHKNSEAYKFFTSSIYKNAIKVGKFTNVVMPIVSNILTSYVVYKKYITNNPNKYNNYNNKDLTGYYQDSKGRWHRPNGQYASNKELGISIKKPTNPNHGNSLDYEGKNYGYVLRDKKQIKF